MKWRIRMSLFISILLIVLLFLHFPLPYHHYNSTTILPRINYLKERSNVTFIHLHSSLLLQFSFDDHRRGNMGQRSLRILFATKMKRPQLNCIFDDKKEIEGEWYEMSENHKKEYGMFILSCTVPVNTQYLETFRITVPNREWMSRELRVDYVIPEKEPNEFRMEYAICSPLVFGMKYTKEKLIEFVEMNKLLGVQKISLYIDYPSVRKELIDTIQFYERQGIVDAVGYHE
ncbi:galt-1, partial [Pristionchus pacificus]